MELGGLRGARKPGDAECHGAAEKRSFTESDGSWSPGRVREAGGRGAGAEREPGEGRRIGRGEGEEKREGGEGEGPTTAQAGRQGGGGLRQEARGRGSHRVGALQGVETISFSLCCTN